MRVMRKTWVGPVISEFWQLFCYANLIRFFSSNVAQFSFMRYLAISKHGKVEKWGIIQRLDQLNPSLSVNKGFQLGKKM